MTFQEWLDRFSEEKAGKGSPFFIVVLWVVGILVFLALAVAMLNGGYSN